MFITAGNRPLSDLAGALDGRADRFVIDRTDMGVTDSYLCVTVARGKFFKIRMSVPKQAGNDHPNGFPTGVFPTRDGAINIAASGERMWRDFLKVAGTTAGVTMLLPKRYRAQASLRPPQEINARARCPGALERDPGDGSIVIANIATGALQRITPATGAIATILTEAGVAAILGPGASAAEVVATVRRAAGVPAELHMYAKTGHGFGLRPERAWQSHQEWPVHLVSFLRHNGFIK